jgi:CheY-like chemotaxis protein
VYFTGREGAFRDKKHSQFHIITTSKVDRYTDSSEKGGCMDTARNRVLVVDDVADAADSAAELLSVWGYDAVAFYSGATALESVGGHRPDAVLLDLAMPGMNGLQFAALFRELPKCGMIPIIAISGYSGEVYQSSARAVGIRRYILKPADPKTLKDLLALEIHGAALAASHKRTSLQLGLVSRTEGDNHAKRLTSRAQS